MASSSAKFSSNSSAQNRQSRPTNASKSNPNSNHPKQQLPPPQPPSQQPQQQQQQPNAAEQRDRKSSSVDEDVCVVCFMSVDIYSIGQCDHPVCFICSTRMRALLKRNECPICRTDMSQVIFSSEKLLFRQLETKNRSGLYDKTYRIIFTTNRAQLAFNKLLEHPCPKCDINPLPSFELLEKHVRKMHECFYCELCTKHLNVSFDARRICRRDHNNCRDCCFFFVDILV